MWGGRGLFHAADYNHIRSDRLGVVGGGGWFPHAVHHDMPSCTELSCRLGGVENNMGVARGALMMIH